MQPIIIHRSALRPKPLDIIDAYLSLSERQSLSIGIYIGGQCYVLGLNENEAVLSYDIGSISKTLTGHLILKLREGGLLDLSAPVSDYLELKQGHYPSLYQLMTHTAGYGHLTPLEITLPRLMRHRYACRNPYEGAGGEAVLRALERRRGDRAGCYHYSDFPYAILALVAEAVAGRPFADQMEDFITSDLGLSHTQLVRGSGLPPAMLGRQSVPYWVWDRRSPYIAAGGICSNLHDMLRYITLQAESTEAYITGGHDICPESFPKSGHIGTTLCWHTYKNSGQLWHVGGVGTFRSSLIVNRRRGLGVAVLGNSKGVSSANVHYLAKMIYSELKLKKVQIHS